MVPPLCRVYRVGTTVDVDMILLCSCFVSFSARFSCALSVACRYYLSEFDVHRLAHSFYSLFFPNLHAIARMLIQSTMSGLSLLRTHFDHETRMTGHIIEDWHCCAVISRPSMFQALVTLQASIIRTPHWTTQKSPPSNGVEAIITAVLPVGFLILRWNLSQSLHFKVR